MMRSGLPAAGAGSSEAGREHAGSGQQAHIVIGGVAKTFTLHGEPIHALEGIDVSIGRGEFFCIVGPSGCGKTTLLRMLAGLEVGSAGVVEIIRSPETTAPKSRATRGLSSSGQPATSMVFQEQSIFPWMTVRDNVAFGLKAQGMGRRERYARAAAFIEQVQLSGFEDALPHQLSGGMKQRVAVARALATDPEILLMDEPFAALDSQTKLTLQDELIQLWEGSRKTVVYVTHSIDEALLLGDRVMVMSARPGKVSALVDVTAVLGRPRSVTETKASPEFGRLFGRIWELLHPEADPSSTTGLGGSK